jgi:hypothetical protein
MAKRGIWLSSQVLIADSPNMTPERREKRKPVVEGSGAMLGALALGAVATAQTAVARQPGGSDDYFVLYDQTNYRGRATNYRGVVSSTGRGTVRSVTIGRGR